MPSSSYPSLPALPDGFRWTRHAWGPGLCCLAMDAVAPHVFTGRLPRLTEPGELAALSVAVGARQVATLTQVHGRDVVALREDAPVASPSPAGDILVSAAPATGILVRAADCVPILMADRRRGVVAAVHAGWRGTVAGAARAAVESMAREFGSRAADLVAAIGPCIGACCYEVGSDVVDAFAAAGHERYLIDRWFVSAPPPRGSRQRSALHLDVGGANRDQLILAGVPADQIHVAGLCTAMHLDVLTSYRAEGERADRLAAVIRAAV